MAKDMREELQKILASNTFVARLVAGSDVKSLPGNKIDILMDDELTVSSYIQVPVLPLPKDAKEGVFYILPNSSINYIIDGQWESVFPTDEVIKKVKKSDGTVLPVDTADMSVTLPQDDLSDGFYFTTATLKIEPGDTQQVAISDIADFNKDNLVIGETTLFDQDGTMAVVISLVNTSTVQTKTMTAVGTGAAAKTFTATSTLLNAEIGGATNVAVADLDGYDSAVCKVGTSFITDKMGRLGIVTSKSATTVAVRTINNITHSGHVMYTTDILDNKRNAVTPLTFSTFDYQYEEAGLVPFIVDKTIVYDQHGTLAKVTSVDETNEQVEVQTFMSIDWAGEAFHHSQLTGEVGEVVEVLVSDLDAYDDDLCIPYRSFIYDNHGRIGIVTAKTVSKLTLSILVSPSSYTEYKTYLQYDPGVMGDSLSQTPLQTTTINTDYILGWDTTLNGRDGKWCVYDANGTLALITNSTPVLGEIEATTLVSSETKHDKFYWINGNDLNGVAIGSQATVDWNNVKDKNGNPWDPAIHPDKYEVGKTMASDMLGTIGVLTGISTVGGPSKLTFKRVSVEVPAIFLMAQSKFNDYGTTNFSSPFGNPSYGRVWTDQTLIFDPSRTAVGSVTGDRQGQFLFKVFKFYRLANGFYLNPTPLGTCVQHSSHLQTYNGNGWGSLSYNTFYKGNGLVFDNNGNIGYISDNSDTTALEITTISSQSSPNAFTNVYFVGYKMSYQSGQRFDFDDTNPDAGETPVKNGERAWLWTNTDKFMGDENNLKAGDIVIDSTATMFRVVNKYAGTEHLWVCARVGTAMDGRLQLDSTVGSLPDMGNTGTFHPNDFKVYRDWNSATGWWYCGPEDIALGQIVSDSAGRYAIVTETNQAYINNQIKVRTIIDPNTLVSFSPRIIEANVGEVSLGNNVYAMRFKGSGISSGSTDDMVELFGLNSNIQSMGATPVIISWGGTVYRNMGSTIRPLKFELVSNYEEINSGSLYDTIPEGTAGLYTTEQQDMATGDPFQAPALIWHQAHNSSLPAGTTIGYDIWITYYKTV